ncbi:MAG: hypothetical protein PSX37_13595 [bacterium]|nr:hypothetical protein [bacterium]
MDEEEPTLDTEFGVEYQDVVVMSQTCDLVPGQKSDMKFAVLCPLWTLAHAEKVNETFRASLMKEECRRGYMPGYHMLAACESPAWPRDVLVVTFKEIVSLPIPLVRTIAASVPERARIRSPYREHLAQAFARFFMRVGLPSDIPPFSGDNAEREALRRLRGLDPAARDRVISAADS